MKFELHKVRTTIFKVEEWPFDNNQIVLQS
jgi:hypothetical protein